MPSAIRVILSFLFYSGFCLALVSPPAIADAEHAQVLNSAAQQLREQGQLTDKTLRDLQRSADGLLLLAWLHEHGRYGVHKDGEKAFAYYQQAAEQGQMEAAYYCWQRCLHLTPALLDALERAADNGDPAALFMRAQWLAEQSPEQLEEAGRMLLAAAKGRQLDALSELYVQHFLDWSSQRRSKAEAEAKLQRCADEGVISCYLLLARFYERHQDAEAALKHYLVLQQLDYDLARRYIYAESMAALEQRLPHDSLTLVRARAAVRLVQHPQTGFDKVDRFAVCADDATYDCVRAVVKEDKACMLSHYADTYLAGLRQSRNYRRCMGFE